MVKKENGLCETSFFQCRRSFLSWVLEGAQEWSRFQWNHAWGLLAEASFAVNPRFPFCDASFPKFSGWVCSYRLSCRVLVDYMCCLCSCRLHNALKNKFFLIKCYPIFGPDISLDSGAGYSNALTQFCSYCYIVTPFCSMFCWTDCRMWYFPWALYLAAEQNGMLLLTSFW